MLACALLLSLLLPTRLDATEPGKAARRSAAAPAAPIPYLPTLQTYVSLYGRRRVEIVYVGWARPDKGRAPTVYAYWPADHSLLLLGVFGDPPMDLLAYDWLHRKARVDLRHDVVPSERDLHGSSYLEPRLWVSRIERACLAGRRLALARPDAEVVRNLRDRLERGLPEEPTP